MKIASGIYMNIFGHLKFKRIVKIISMNIEFGNYHYYWRMKIHEFI